MANEDYRGRVVVLTGASSGFGKGAARELAARGCRLVLAARRKPLLDDLVRECEVAGGEAIAVECDVSRPEDVERLANEALAKFGRIDVWINDAGVGAVGRFDEIPLETHEQLIRTNLLGTIYGSHHAIRHFRQQRGERGERGGRGGGGTLINIASSIGKIPAPFYASYVASKFGVVGLCDALRAELRESGEMDIRVCTVMPMAHDTPFFEHAANFSGRVVQPIPPTYDPKVTVDAIVRLVAEPEDEVITGAQGKVFNIAHHLFPDAVEKFMAKSTKKAQYDDAPPGRDTLGAVHEPTPSGDTVSGGWLEKEGKRTKLPD